MKVTDLMIGSIVTYDGDVIVVKLYDLVTMKKSKIEKEKYQPIELNDEWLTRLGFKPNGESTDEDYVESDNTNIKLAFCDNGIYELANKNIKVKYIHQLQILARAVTGGYIAFTAEYTKTMRRTIAFKNKIITYYYE
jgi:hypothetical protein